MNVRFAGALGKSAKKRASAKGEKGALFEPGGSPAQLWMRDPDKRKVDLSGIFGPEDTIIAVARGMHPGVLRDMDDRATIRGGLTVLKALGVSKYAKVNVENMKSTTANTKEDDDALAKAGGAATLRDAANKVRQVVHKHHLDRAAWGARQLYILDNLKGFNVGRTVATTIVGAIPLGITQAVAAAMAVHGAISAQVAKSVMTQADKDVKAGLASAKAKASQEGEAPRDSALVGSGGRRRPEAPATPSPAAGAGEVSVLPAVAGINPLWIGGALAALLVGGALILRRKS